MNELQVFNFNGLADIRTTTDENNEVWFIAKDIADALDYPETKNALRLCKRAESARNGDLNKINNLHPATKWIPESDVFRLIMKSTKVEAEQFQDFVCEDVLPTIRRTGKYDISESQWLEEKQSLESKVNQLILKIESVDTEAHYTVMDNMTLLSDLNVLCFLKRRELDDEEKRTKTARKTRDTLKYNVYHMDFFQLEEAYKDRLELEELRIKAEDIVFKYDPSNPRRFKLQSLPNVTLPTTFI